MEASPPAKWTLLGGFGISPQQWQLRLFRMELERQSSAELGGGTVSEDACDISCIHDASASGVVFGGSSSSSAGNGPSIGGATVSAAQGPAVDVPTSTTNADPLCSEQIN